MFPALRLEDIRQYDNLDFIARQVVEGFIVGMHKSPMHGFSVEFAEHRLYNFGEDVRNIDWKVYARTDRLYVKRFEEETNLRCQLVIDASSSMFYPLPHHNKLFFSVYAAAALMHILRRQRDAVGLSIFSDALIVHTPAKSSQVHHRYLLTELEKLLKTAPRNKRTAATTALHQIAEVIHKRSLVIIFSDMMESIEAQDAIFTALQHLRHNKHEVIVFHVVDKHREQDFEFENRPYQFVDVETGETLRLHPSEVKEHYKRLATAFRTKLLLRCGQYGIDFVEADVNREFWQILLPYLVKRMKMN